jgi:hypothetical protein
MTTTYTEREMRRLLRTAYRDMRRTSDRRRELPIGSSRARVTTANARWSTACEHYWRLRGTALEMGLGEYVTELEAA